MLIKFKINGKYYQIYCSFDKSVRIDFTNSMSLSDIVYILDWEEKGDARDIEVYEKQYLELDKKIAKNCKVTVVESSGNYFHFILNYDYIFSDISII